MIRRIWLALGLATLSVLLIAIHADPHLWGQALTVLNHKAQHAGTSINSHLNGWITPSGKATP